MIHYTSFEGLVRIWALDGQLLNTFKADDVRVNTLRFFADENRLLGGKADGSIVVWDCSGKELLHAHGDNFYSDDYAVPVKASSLPTPKPDTTSAQPPTPTVPKDPTAARWFAAEGTNGHYYEILTTNLIANDTLVLTVDVYGESRLWNAVSGEQIAPLEDHYVVAVAGRFAASINSKGSESEIQLWERRREPSQSRLSAQPEIWIGVLLIVLVLYRIYSFLRRKPR